MGGRVVSRHKWIRQNWRKHNHICKNNNAIFIASKKAEWKTRMAVISHCNIPHDLLYEIEVHTLKGGCSFVRAKIQ